MFAKRHEVPQCVHARVLSRSKFDKKTQRATRELLSEGTLEVDIAAEAAEAALELDAFERRLAQVKQYKKVPKGAGGLSWSNNCAHLQEILAAERHDATSVAGGSSLSTWSQLGAMIDDLDLSHSSLGELDAKARIFSKLATLNVSHNLLQVLVNLPASLQSLQAYDNVITSPPRCPLPELIHLGIGHNYVASLEGLSQQVPHLYSLDISFNSITDLEDILPFIGPQQLPNLKRLSVAGNPAALTHGARAAIVQAAPELQYLDTTDVTFSQRRAMRKRAAARAQATQAAAEAAARDAVATAAWAADMQLQGWVPPQALSQPASASSTPRKGGARSTAPSKPPKGGKGTKSSKSPKAGKSSEEEAPPAKQVISWDAAMQHPQLSAVAQAATAAVFAQAAALDAEAAQGVLLGVEVHAVSGLPSAASIAGGDADDASSSASSTPRKRAAKGGAAKNKGKAGKSPRSSETDDEAEQPKEEYRLFVQVSLPGGGSLRTTGGLLGKDGVLAWGQVQNLRHVLPVSVETRDALLFDGLDLQLWEEHVQVAPGGPTDASLGAAAAGAGDGDGDTSTDGCVDIPQVQETVLTSACLAEGHLSTEELLGSTVGDRLYCGVDAEHWALELGAGSTQLQLTCLPSETLAAIQRAAGRQVAEDMEEEAAAAAQAAGAAASGGKGSKKPSKTPLPQDDESTAARQEEAHGRTAQLARAIAKECLSSACVCLGVGVSVCVDGPPPSTAPPPALAEAVIARQAALQVSLSEEQPNTSRSSSTKKGGRKK